MLDLYVPVTDVIDLEYVSVLVDYLNDSQQEHEDVLQMKDCNIFYKKVLSLLEKDILLMTGLEVCLELEAPTGCTLRVPKKLIEYLELEYNDRYQIMCTTDTVDYCLMRNIFLKGLLFLFEEHYDYIEGEEICSYLAYRYFKESEDYKLLISLCDRVKHED